MITEPQPGELTAMEPGELSMELARESSTEWAGELTGMELAMDLEPVSQHSHVALCADLLTKVVHAGTQGDREPSELATLPISQDEPQSTRQAMLM